MRIKFAVLSILLISAAWLFLGCSAARPLHRSHASIRHSILKRTPPGTTEPQVAAFIAHEGWQLDRNGMNLELAHEQGGGPHVPEGVHDVWSADFGGYVIFFGTREIYGIWAFDDKGRLINVWIYKERDGL